MTDDHPPVYGRRGERNIGLDRTDSMKILHVMAGKDNGGAETYSTDVMLALHRSGLDQCIVVRDNAPRARELEASGLRLAKGVLRPPLHILRRRHLADLIRREEPDIVHCWMRRAVSLMPASVTAQAVVGWFGDYEDVGHFARCTHLVGVTEDIVHSMRQSGIPQETATYIPTFPSVVDMAPIDRGSLDTPNDATVLLTLSRLHPVKGLDTLLHALAQVPNAFLWMAGEGPMRSGLEDLARKLGVEARVRFLGWRTDRGALLKSADICVLPSRYEPFGTVILEAWATRKPFVACASAGPKAHVRNGVNGMLAPIDDAPALAATINTVIQDAGLRARIVERGFADYERGFTHEAITTRWIDYYRSLIKAPPQAHIAAAR